MKYKDNSLLPSEQKVYALAIEGFDTVQIASLLQIKLHTVKSHLNAIYKKLGVETRTQLVALHFRPEMIALPARQSLYVLDETDGALFDWAWKHHLANYRFEGQAENQKAKFDEFVRINQITPRAAMALRTHLAIRADIDKDNAILSKLRAAMP